MAKVTHRHRDFLKRQAKAAGLGGGVMTKFEKREFLRRVVLDGGQKMSDRLYALEIDNKMSGDNEPDKVALSLSAGMFAALQKKDGE